MTDLEKELRELNEQIKNREFKNIYLFYGKEEYLKNFYIEKICASILDEGSMDMNLDIINSDNYDIKTVKEKVQTLPFLADKRIILFKDVDTINKKDLAEVFFDIPNTTIVLISEQANKKRKSNDDTGKKGDVLKVIKSKGYILELEKVTENLAAKKVVGVFKESKKKIQNVDATYMVNRVGLDLTLLMNETQKVIAYLGEREEVNKDDIDLMCTQNLESKVFDLIKFICNKDFEKAMKSYNNLIINKEPQVMILYMISRQYMIMYETTRLVNEGYTNTQIMSLTEAKQEFVVKEALLQGKKYGVNTLKKILKECLETDLKLKNGEDVLSLLIFKLIKIY